MNSGQKSLFFPKFPLEKCFTSLCTLKEYRALGEGEVETGQCALGQGFLYQCDAESQSNFTQHFLAYQPAFCQNFIVFLCPKFAWELWVAREAGGSCCLFIKEIGHHFLPDKSSPPQRSPCLVKAGDLIALLSLKYPGYFLPSTQ